MKTEFVTIELPVEEIKQALKYESTPLRSLDSISDLLIDYVKKCAVLGRGSEIDKELDDIARRNGMQSREARSLAAEMLILQFQQHGVAENAESTPIEK